VGKPWGLDADKAIVMAEACVRHEIGVTVQQDLWHNVISKAQWTQQSMKLFMDRFGQIMNGRGDSPDDGGMLFALPPNAAEVIKRVTALADQRRRAQRGLQWLLGAKDALAEFPDLVALLDRDGENMVARVKEAQQEDAVALCGVVMN